MRNIILILSQNISWFITAIAGLALKIYLCTFVDMVHDRGRAAAAATSQAETAAETTYSYNGLCKDQSADSTFMQHTWAASINF